MSIAVLPRTILPTGYRDLARMHKRTSYLTDYVARNVERHSRIVLGKRLKTPSRRQHAYEATFMEKPHSFLIVPAANWFANVSDMLERVDYAIIVAFDKPLSELEGELPTTIDVYNVSADKLIQMRKIIQGKRGEGSRSQSVSVPLFRSVVESNPGNVQCKAGSLESAMVKLWSSEIEWVKNERELGYRPEEKALLDELLQTGKRLRVTTDAGVMLFDTAKVKLELVE